MKLKFNLSFFQPDSIYCVCICTCSKHAVDSLDCWILSSFFNPESSAYILLRICPYFLFDYWTFENVFYDRQRSIVKNKLCGSLK